MNDLLDLATFRSRQFKPILPEDCQVNPGCYGAELAYWLCARLIERGIVTSYPEYEDWGWMLSYTTDADEEFALYCGNVEGEDDEWLVGLSRYGRRLFFFDKPPFAHAEALVRAVREVLEAEPTVTDLDWRYDATSGQP